MDYFQLLLLAHVIGDFTLQTDSIFRLKQKSAWGVPLHVLICSLVNVALFYPLLDRLAIWLVILFIALVHFTLDRTKLFLALFHARDGLGYFFIDQALHLLSLLGGAWYLQATLPQQTFWLTPWLTTTLSALVIAAFAAPPIIHYIQLGMAGVTVRLKGHGFPSFRHRLPGILSRLLATLGLILGGWYNLFVLTLLSALVLPTPAPGRSRRYRYAELAVGAAITFFCALFAWYVRAR